MGGNAFQESKRFDLSTKIYLQNLIDSKLKSICEYHFISELKEKYDFGDLDVLVDLKYKDYVKNTLFKDYPRIEFKTRNIVNILINNSYQIDLIFIDKSYLNIAQFYFSYNDLNNLVGKVAHTLDLSFGFKGLYYKLYLPYSGKKLKVFLSKDPKQIYTYLDYDYKRYVQGFNTFEEVFNFVTSSKYFEAEKFSLEHLKHRDRARDKKRKAYNKFLEWLSNKQFKDDIIYRPKLNLIEQAEKFFKVDIKSKVLKEILKDRELEKHKRKFNGEIVKTLTGLENKQLGEFIKYFKSKYNKEFILTRSPLTIEHTILQEFTSWKNIIL